MAEVTSDEKNTSTEITTVLFDMFGVIARLQADTGKASIAALAVDDAQSEHEPFWQAYWGQRPDYDRGVVAGPAYWQRVAEELGVEYPADKIQALIAADLASWSSIDSAMVEFLPKVKATGRDIALLSNIPVELAARFRQNFTWLNEFTVLGLSCQIGHAKPEAEAYQWCLARLPAAPEQILFVDDNPENVAAAQELGLQGQVFQSREELAFTLGMA